MDSKRWTKHFAFIAVPLVAILAATCISLAGNTPAVGKPTMEKNEGPVRVVLLRVRNIAGRNSQPRFVVTYGVEIPLEGAFSDLSFGSKDEIALIQNGKTLNTTGEVASGSMGFEDLPRQDELTKPVIPEGKAMLAEEIIFTGLTVQSKQIDLKIQFSWRGTPLHFDFKDVPVN